MGAPYHTSILLTFRTPFVLFLFLIFSLLINLHLKTKSNFSQILIILTACFFFSFLATMGDRYLETVISPIIIEDGVIINKFSFSKFFFNFTTLQQQKILLRYFVLTLVFTLIINCAGSSRSKIKTFLVLSILPIGFIVLIIGLLTYNLIHPFLVSRVIIQMPKNYDECITRPKAQYNKLSCELDFFDSEYSRKTIQNCYDKGGCFCGLEDAFCCTIVFLNSDVTFPKNFEECKRFGGVLTGAGNVCNFPMDAHCSPKEEAERVMKECPYKIGQDKGVCKQSFFLNLSPTPTP